jgi:hypothetical protein
MDSNPRAGVRRRTAKFGLSQPGRRCRRSRPRRSNATHFKGHHQRVARVSESARANGRIAGRDAVSQDVLIDVVRSLDGEQWILRAQLSERA